MKGRKVTLDVQQTSDSTKVNSRNGTDLSSPATTALRSQKMARKMDVTTAKIWMKWMTRRSFSLPGAQWWVTVTAIGPRFPNAISTERYAGKFHPETIERAVLTHAVKNAENASGSHNVNK